MSDRLVEIRGRLKAATPGPWEIITDEATGLPTNIAQARPGELWEIGSVCDFLEYGGLDKTEANADLLVHSRDDLEWAAEEIERLRELCEVPVGGRT